MGNSSLQPALTRRAPDTLGEKFERGSLPDFPKRLRRLRADELEDLLDEVGKRCGFASPHTSAPKAGSDDPNLNREINAAIEQDHRAQWLIDGQLMLDTGRRGQLYLECPFKDGHSSDSGHTETAYFPAETGGFYHGHYKCMHATCAERSCEDFDRALGYPGPDLGELFDAHDSDSEVVIDPRDPMSTARQVYSRRFSRNDQPVLIRSGGSWYEYANSYYRERDEEVVRSAVWQLLETALTVDKLGKKVPARVTSAQISAGMDALKSVTRRLEQPEPCWLDGREGPAPADLVSLRDGLFDLTSRKLLPHTPAFFSLHALPFDAPKKGDRAPRWIAFLEEVWPSDSAAQQTLQEVMGLFLTADTSLQKAFLMVGPRRSGKGVIARVIRMLLGEHNVVGPTMSSLSGNFGLQPLIGKLAALISDARFRHGQYSHAAVERLLLLTGEDTVTVDRKNKEAWTGKMSVRIMITSNEVPKLSDASGAIASRFITLKMSQTFYGKEDPGLTDKLRCELPGIFEWALEGRDRLMERGYFLQPKSGHDLAERLSELGNPVGNFIDECCALDKRGSETIDALYQVYREWCAANGHHPTAKNQFSQDMETACASISRHQPRVGQGGKQVKSFKGIRLQRDSGAGSDDDDDGYI
ncbi:hypothetical protein EAH84_04885 [Sphingomonas oligophenolica]|uniref:SF3 helicase domain-containing protein n=2 Tax=Sphingomonas oligophenolica TaxID=301154 RepID=A0A502CKU2_9SPHN|nr:hypothetical protein EAH84_04885 [Sphingomonas oligophenolica]